MGPLIRSTKLAACRALNRERNLQRILLVDDDAVILDSLKREFLARKDEFEVVAYASAKEALIHAGENLFDIAISDFKMPEMDGVTFTKALWEIQPAVACIILSDRSDRDELVNTTRNVLRSRPPSNQAGGNSRAGGASNRSHILRFLNKPWDEMGLAGLVAQALAFRKALLENQRLVAKCDRPAQPAEPNKHYQILVVEEQNVFNAVARGLTHHTPFHGMHAMLRNKIDLESRRGNTDYRFIVETSTSPHEALKLAERISYDVVISDCQMSKMDGMDFLGRIREIQPHTPRLLLSGQGEMTMLIEAINRAGVYGFIGKQWSRHDLNNAVTQAITYRNLLLENNSLVNLLNEQEARAPRYEWRRVMPKG